MDQTEFEHVSNEAPFEAFLQSLTQTHRQLIDGFVKGLRPKSEVIPEADNLFDHLMQGLIGGAGQVLDVQRNCYRQQMDLWSGLLGGGAVASSAQDRRFAAQEWEDYPFFDFVKQHYLLASKWLTTVVDGAPMDDASREKAIFYTRQFIDAMSPSNFALTNPEVIKLAIETQGQSLAEGMKQLAVDLDKGQITMSDETHFAVGENLATTPGSVIFQNDLLQLIQYKAVTSEVYERPILFVPPSVNKYYLMDLQPSNSMVRHFVERGYTVFIISWRNIPQELGKLTWDDYVESGVIRALEAVRSVGGQDRVHVLGFCIGGVILTTSLAVLKARGLDWVESVTFMTSLIDHAEPGDMKMFVDWDLVRAREHKMDEGGVVDGKELARAFSLLRANDLIWSYVVNNYLKGKTPPLFDLLFWNNDSANLPLPMHTFYLREMYLENNLAKQGTMKVCGVPVDVSHYDWPTYIFAAREDHIVPWRSAYRSTQLIGSDDIRFVLGASGHIAGSINPVAANKRNYWVNEALPEAAEAWFEGAESKPGSWWQNWDDWLAPMSGHRVPAPDRLGNKEYLAIEQAPGSYVKAKCE